MANQVPEGAIDVVLILFGAALALISSIVVEVVRGWVSDRRKARTAVGILRAEIETTVVGLRAASKFASKHEASEMPVSEIQPIAEMVRGALRRLDHYRDGILLIKEEKVRQDILNFLGLVEALCGEAMVGGTLPIRTIIEPFDELAKRGSGLLEQLRELKA